MFGHASIVSIFLALFLDFPLIPASSTKTEDCLALICRVLGSVRHLCFFFPLVSHVWTFYRALESGRARKRLEPDKKFTSTLRLVLNSSIDAEQECPICKAEFLDPEEKLTALALPCGHIWCKTCIEDYVVKQRRIADCPLCPRPISHQSLRSKIVSFQMAFASTVWSMSMFQCFAMLFAAVWMLFRDEATSFPTTPLPMGARTIGRAGLDMYYVLDLVSAALDLLGGSLSWALSWWTTSRNGESCGIVGTTQRIVLPVLHFGLSLLAYDSTIKNPTQPATLVDLRAGHFVLMVLPWIVHGLALLNGTWVVSFLRMEDQRWFRSFLDILL